MTRSLLEGGDTDGAISRVYRASLLQPNNSESVLLLADIQRRVSRNCLSFIDSTVHLSHSRCLSVCLSVSVSVCLSLYLSVCAMMTSRMHEAALTRLSNSNNLQGQSPMHRTLTAVLVYLLQSLGS